MKIIFIILIYLTIGAFIDDTCRNSNASNKDVLDDISPWLVATLWPIPITMAIFDLIRKKNS